jgi:glucose/arabinose dehydrogenase
MSSPGLHRAWIAALAIATGCDTEAARCPGDNGGITLPDGFCATVYADQLGHARHMAVTPSGDVLVAIAPSDAGDPGHVTALRDADRDGVAEVVEVVANVGGNGIAWAGGMLYVAASDRIVAFALPDGAYVPERSQILISGLPVGGDHNAKTIVPVGESLYVNHGSATNACQVENRVLHSPGLDPCPELSSRAGVWRFAAAQVSQQSGQGARFAAGIRNANALAVDGSGTLWAAVNGRDQLHENWPELFDEDIDLRLPGEDVVALHEGDDRGWPYCYHDPERGRMMLAPEYGGDGEIQGRCAAIAPPALALPAHWAPLGMAFYGAGQFPARYRGGAFIANHGSRFDVNATYNPGYNVVFVPFADGAPAGPWEEFAAGFTGGGLPLPDAAAHRPVGVAVMPDGALLISDDKAGRIWRVTYPD